MKKKKQKNGKNSIRRLMATSKSGGLKSKHVMTNGRSLKGNGSCTNPMSNGKHFQGIKCDKLLKNMLRKKKKRKLQEDHESTVALLSTSDADGNSVLSESQSSSHDQTQASEENLVIMPKSKKRRLRLNKKRRLATKEDDETTPLLLEEQEIDVDAPHETNAGPSPGRPMSVKSGGNNAISPGSLTAPELPIAECREMFIKNFLENDTLIVVGETGSGKSTQIPQYLIQDCPHLFSYRGMAVTQPRRVAAISLANRVAYELGTTVGELVGYKVRFEKETSKETKITFLTDGFLMMDAIRDNLFREYSVVIVDEAHERSVETDVVISLLRNAQICRSKLNPKKKLKLIVMSATLDIDKFKTFYDLSDHGIKSKAVYIKGRPYDLQMNYLPKESLLGENHLELAWITLLKLHLQLPVEDHILLFLTGKEEIDLIVARTRVINQQKNLPRVFVCPLYAALPKDAQLKSFDLPPENTRKIVVSTNIAETSLTIPGIRVVIDSGRVKSKYFEQSFGMDVLQVQLVSKSQADQRAGRAGREFEGSVYRLYTKTDYERMEVFPPPEITRSNLSRILLLASVSLGIDDFTKFPLPDRPTHRAVQYAMKELHQFGAIESAQLPIKITRIAKRLLSFPVELHLARVLYLAVQYQELSRICAIVAMLTVESIYFNNQASHEQTEDAEVGRFRQNKYQSLWEPEGDFMTFWRIFRDYKKSKNKKSWCKEHGIQFKTMVYIVQVWRHLLTVARSMELEDDEKVSAGDAVQFSEKCGLIFKTAFSHQQARLSAKGNFYIVESQCDPSTKFHAKIHPSSSLIQRKPGRLIFTHLSFNEADNAVFMHNCGVI